MRVTQILALLRIAPELQAYVRSLPPGTPERRVTERGLRRLTKMTQASQLAYASKHVPGFGAFLVLQNGAEVPRSAGHRRRAGDRDERDAGRA